MTVDGRDPWAALVVDDRERTVDPPPLPGVVDGWDDDIGTFEREDEASRYGTRAAHRLIVVVGATGGVGATTVASGLALATARSGTASLLLDLDFDSGDSHVGWGVPRDRTLGDLADVVDELVPDHLAVVAYEHDSGVGLLMSPAERGASARWSRVSIGRLLDAAAVHGVAVVDAGRAHPAHIDVARERAGLTVVVAPPTLRGVRRTRALVEQGGAGGVAVCVADWGHRELSARAFSRACGLDRVTTLPRAPREAGALASGRLVAQRRSRLGERLAELMREDG